MTPCGVISLLIFRRAFHGSGDRGDGISSVVATVSTDSAGTGGLGQRDGRLFYRRFRHDLEKQAVELRFGDAGLGPAVIGDTKFSDADVL